ncbi:phage head closure protein [Stenotrophomonas maltophilia]|uniref:phage head closure protein n=1 Tax=Stenotrophomonas TaxID=40323 RepID=UPI00058694AE|nr:phage head closure protein [Stenotrophomonas sp. SKA14]
MRRAGKYRQRVTIRHRTLIEDEYNDQIEVWADWRTDVPAEVVPLSGKEFIEAGASQDQLSARIEIPYLPGVDATMRILHDGNLYAVQAVLPDPTARQHLTLMVATRRGND